MARLAIVRAEVNETGGAEVIEATTPTGNRARTPPEIHRAERASGDKTGKAGHERRSVSQRIRCGEGIGRLSVGMRERGDEDCHRDRESGKKRWQCGLRAQNCKILKRRDRRGRGELPRRPRRKPTVAEELKVRALPAVAARRRHDSRRDGGATTSRLDTCYCFGSKGGFCA